MRLARSAARCRPGYAFPKVGAWWRRMSAPSTYRPPIDRNNAHPQLGLDGFVLLFSDGWECPIFPPKADAALRAEDKTGFANDGHPCAGLKNPACPPPACRSRC